MLYLLPFYLFILGDCHQELSKDFSNGENSFSLLKRAVPKEIWQVKPYDISTGKYGDKIDTRKQEGIYDPFRVQRAEEKYAIVRELDQQKISKVAGKHFSKVEEIEREMESLRERQRKAEGKMVAFDALRGKLEDMTSEWKYYNRMEKFKQDYPDYENRIEYFPVDEPEGIPEISREEIENYFPCGFMQNQEAANWQIKMLQAAKITGKDARIFDPFANQAIIDYYHKMGIETSSQNNEYQRAMAELEAVINLDAYKAKVASDLSREINEESNVAMDRLKAPLKYYRQKFEAWSNLSAKRIRRN